MRQCILCGKMFTPDNIQDRNNICDECDTKLEDQWSEAQKAVDHPSECLSCNKKLDGFLVQSNSIYCRDCTEILSEEIGDDTDVD